MENFRRVAANQHMQQANTQVQNDSTNIDFERFTYQQKKQTKEQKSKGQAIQVPAKLKSVRDVPRKIQSHHTRPKSTQNNNSLVQDESKLTYTGETQIDQSAKQLATIQSQIEMLKHELQAGTAIDRLDQLPYEQRIEWLQREYQKNTAFEIDYLQKQLESKQSTDTSQGRCCCKFNNRRGARLINIIDVICFFNPLRWPVALIAYFFKDSFPLYAKVRFFTYFVQLIGLLITFCILIANLSKTEDGDDHEYQTQTLVIFSICAAVFLIVDLHWCLVINYQSKHPSQNKRPIQWTFSDSEPQFHFMKDPSFVVNDKEASLQVQIEKKYEMMIEEMKKAQKFEEDITNIEHKSQPLKFLQEFDQSQVGNFHSENQFLDEQFARRIKTENESSEKKMFKIQNEGQLANDLYIENLDNIDDDQIRQVRRVKSKT